RLSRARPRSGRSRACPRRAGRAFRCRPPRSRGCRRARCSRAPRRGAPRRGGRPGDSLRGRRPRRGSRLPGRARARAARGRRSRPAAGSAPLPRAAPMRGSRAPRSRAGEASARSIAAAWRPAIARVARCGSRARRPAVRLRRQGAGGRSRRVASGTVYLVGAGPGDPGCLTLRGRDCLGRADVVVYDYLANPELLRHAPARAERVFAGKHGRGPRLLEQDEINRLLVERARAGQTVVRLKGGDPMVFGRGGEEAEALVAAGVPFEVVPGVTAALAVPAFAGIPVTHRDWVSGVTVVTGHEAEHESRVRWDRIATAGNTIVLMMGVTQIRPNLEGLLAAGLPPDTPGAAVRWGGTPRQQVV